MDMSWPKTTSVAKGLLALSSLGVAAAAGYTVWKRIRLDVKEEAADIIADVAPTKSSAPSLAALLAMYEPECAHVPRSIESIDDILRSAPEVAITILCSFET